MGIDVVGCNVVGRSVGLMEGLLVGGGDVVGSGVGVMVGFLVGVAVSSE